VRRNTNSPWPFGTVYRQVNAFQAFSALLIGATPPDQFGHTVAYYFSVDAGRSVASTCEPDNQGNSGFARRGD